jgi:hypothetical protein
MSISARMPTLIPRDSLLTGKNTGGFVIRTTHFCDSSAQTRHVPWELLTMRARNDSAIIGDVTGKGFPVPMFLSLTCDERLAGFPLGVEQN